MHTDQPSPLSIPNPIAADEKCVAPRRPRVWTVFGVFALAQVLDLVAAGVITLLVAWKTGNLSLDAVEKLMDSQPGADQSVGLQLGLILSTMAVFTSAAILGAVLSPVRWRERLRLQAAKLPGMGWAIGFCGMMAIGVVYSSLDGLSLIPKSPVWEDLAAFTRQLSGLKFLAAVLAIGVAPGIAEELLFRGYIQTRLSARWGASWGIFVTAVLFGVMHMDVVQGVFAMIIGLYLGYLTEKTGSILPAIILHATNNSLATILDRWAIEIDGSWPNVVALVTGLALTCVCLYYLRAKVTAPIPFRIAGP